MRHFNGQQIAIDKMEKRDINVTFHDDEEVTLEQDTRDIALKALLQRWMQETCVQV
jgi:hypothetical protein